MFEYLCDLVHSPITSAILNQLLRVRKESISDSVFFSAPSLLKCFFLGVFLAAYYGIFQDISRNQPFLKRVFTTQLQPQIISCVKRR